jgi:RNA polymerase sigma-70 factor (ECF subfamily)
VGGDLTLAEDAVADAFAAAAEGWLRDGVPSRPGGWLTTVARRRAIDHLRRTQTRDRNQGQLQHLERLMRDDTPALDDGTDASSVTDDRLRLLFTCCHPALALEARIALTLRTVAGLDVGDVARAFLSTETTMYQRLVRAKRKIRAAGIAYRVPADDELPERLEGLLHVVLLIFNEGHVASSGDDLQRLDLCDEALRLARLVVELLPDEPEAQGLLALLLCSHARSAARADDDGMPIALEDQDRTRWDLEAIAEGVELLDRALAARRPGPFQIQAAISALHAEAPVWEMTDWPQIAALYRELEQRQRSPVVTLNRAAAIAFADGPHAGLAILEPLVHDERLARYQPLHATHAELLARAGQLDDASLAYRRAIDLTTNRAERAALEARARRLLGTDTPSDETGPPFA